MMPDLSNGKTLKAVLVSNIIVLVSAIISLVWGVATTKSEFEAVKKEQERVSKIQFGVIVEQETMKARLTNGEAARIVIDGRLLRLESLHFDRGGGR